LAIHVSYSRARDHLGLLVLIILFHPLPLIVLVCAPLNAALRPLPSEAPATSATRGDEEHKARELFEKAEALAAKSKYKEARRAYAKLVREYSHSSLAATAERRSRPSGFAGSADIVRHGPSANRVDVVLMGEGYEIDHQKAFEKLAEKIPGYFARQKTFGEYFKYFNFLRANLVSAESGVDGFGREYDTALGGHTLDTYAGHVAIDTGLVRQMLDEMDEHDGQAIVFVKNGIMGTGGGGVATIGGLSIKTAIHEFGHSFGGLADEYSTETHKRSGVRRAANVAATEDPEAVPWKHWIAAKVPGVGVYEGASGQVRGAWKPTSGGCVMESGEFFCRPCREELVLDIYRYVDPIDECIPATHARRATEALILGGDPLEFRVKVLEPKSHSIAVRWWVFPEAEVPQGPARDPGRRYGRRRGDRSDRGPLARIDAKPVLSYKQPKRGGWTKFKLRLSRDMAPGRYRVVCRAIDTTKHRGERWPWVLNDEDGLLESERAWWVEVAERP